MKKIIAACTLALTFAGSGIAHSETLTMGTEGAYAPFNYIDDSGNVAGFDIAIGNEVCKRMKADCIWKTNEWDTIIPNLIAGNYDTIAAGMSITDERKKTINFTEEYYPPTASKFASRAGKEWDFENLSGATIGVQGATIQAAYAQENFGSGNVIKSYETGEQSLADLAAGAVDMVLADGDFLKTVVENSEGALVFVGSDHRIGGGIGIGVRKGDDKLLASLNEAIAAAKADGTVDKLLMEYFKIGPFYMKYFNGQAIYE